MLNTENFSITYLSKKSRLPRLPFLAMKEKILGKSYELSVVVATPALSKKLNRERRGKNKPTNILSFELAKDSGEIVLELGCIRRDAPKFSMKYGEFVRFLFIHGLLHLKGHAHGSTMEKQEKKWMKFFSE